MTLPRAALAVLPLVLAAAVPAPAAAQEVPYTVAVEGAEGELGPLVDRVSRLEELAGKPPPSEVALRRRMDEDRGRIREALRSQGYYDGTVAIDLDGAAQPARVVIRLAPGPQYRLAAVDIESGQVPAPLSPAELGVEPGQPAKAAAVAAAGDKLVTGFGQQGHPLATVTGRQVVVDHHDHTMRVSLTIDPGPFLRFGPVDIAGLASLDPRVVRDRLPWRPGDTFDTRLLEEARRRLADTRLFGTIKVAAGKVAAATGPAAGGTLPVTITVTERAQRTVGAGASYSTSDGPGVQAYWEDRNLLGGAEQLRLSGLVTSRRRDAVARFRDPDFGAVDQDLLVSLEGLREHTESYDATVGSATTGMEWRLSKAWWASAALRLERQYELRGPVGRTFTLGSVPLQLRRDTTDDLLDPSQGSRATALIQPYTALVGPPARFVHVELADSAYLRVLRDPRLVLAGWGRVGTILGAGGLDAVPDLERYYAGGGGSVRGYRYQFAGPLDNDGRPTGGLGLTAFGAEARVQVAGDIGVAFFLEAGTVGAAPTPPVSGFHWGAGLGLRYATPFGPLRLDLAVPLAPRRQDDRYEIYLSLGQAF